MMKPASLRQLGSCCLPHALQNPAGSSSVRGAGRCYPSSRTVWPEALLCVNTQKKKEKALGLANVPYTCHAHVVMTM